MDVLKNVEDPELAFSIVDLGLVYRVDIRENAIEVDFTLTYPGLPGGRHHSARHRRDAA